MTLPSAPPGGWVAADVENVESAIASTNPSAEHVEGFPEGTDVAAR